MISLHAPPDIPTSRTSLGAGGKKLRASGRISREGSGTWGVIGDDLAPRAAGHSDLENVLGGGVKEAQGQRADQQVGLAHVGGHPAIEDAAAEDGSVGVHR